MSDKDIERLCAGYRTTVEDPPYDAVDADLMRAAERSARRARRLPMRRLAYGIAATLLATLGIAAGLRSGADARRHSHSEMPTARVPEGPKNPAGSYLSNATLDSASGERRDHAEALVIRVIKRVGLQRREAGFLQEASALSPLGAEAACGTVSRIDLNAPGALAALRATRPGDYVTVMRIIAGLTRHPELDVPRWISATFHAGNVSYFPLWMTSLPPKRRLGFCLQDARYTAVVTITPNGARLSRTDYRGNPRAPGR